ncbi:hypothetical protein [Paludibacterium denitrificans]|uniref:hypothetical protein n=1 Tax=Paludibacterium denitrificans TaxID=2675226 RepID=UPI001E4F26C5|nr:hypothetical protein [Paludibacterium denitrificans]
MPWTDNGALAAPLHAGEANMLNTMPRVLSLIPPMTQLNTPYPSTAYLTGFLRSRQIPAQQADLALALVLRLFSPAGLQAMHARIDAMPHQQRSAQVQEFMAQFPRYLATIGPVIGFLQGRDSTVAHRICSRQFLPEGSRFASLDVYVDPDDPEGGDPLSGPLVHWASRTVPVIWPRSI